MADCMPAQISIGGALPAPLVQGLYDAIEQQRVDFATSDHSIESLEAFEKDLRKGGVLVLFDDYAPYGEMDELEEFCRKHGLTYVRCSAALYQHDGAVTWWRPGMKRPGYTLATQEGQPAVEVSDVRDALSASTAEKKLAAVSALLKKVTPPDVPPLVVITGP